MAPPSILNVNLRNKYVFLYLIVGEMSKHLRIWVEFHPEFEKKSNRICKQVARGLFPDAVAAKEQELVVLLKRRLRDVGDARDDLEIVRYYYILLYTFKISRYVCFGTFQTLRDL